MLLNVAPGSLLALAIIQEELRRVMMALDPSLSHSDLEIIFSGADLSKVRVRLLCELFHQEKCGISSWLAYVFHQD